MPFSKSGLSSKPFCLIKTREALKRHLYIKKINLAPSMGQNMSNSQSSDLLLQPRPCMNTTANSGECRHPQFSYEACGAFSLLLFTQQTTAKLAE
uniref:Uncharacterized protein n=1 Tax=Anguilla anguilla TaxID=7936 RepID=A0A0E9SS64_ANGAN